MGLSRLTSYLLWPLAGDDVDGEVVRAGEQREVVEVDGGQLGGVGAVERVGDVELVVAGVLVVVALVVSSLAPSLWSAS